MNNDWVNELMNIEWIDEYWMNWWILNELMGIERIDGHWIMNE